MKKMTITLLAALTFAVGAYENAGKALQAGHAFNRKGKSKEAIAAFEEAFKLAKTNSEKYTAVFYNGIARTRIKDYDGGIEKIRESMKYAKSGNSLSSSQFHVAYYLGIQKKYDEAIAEMKKVSEAAKGVSNYYTDTAPVLIGRYLLYQKKYAQAGEAAEKSTASKRLTTAVSAWEIVFDASLALKDMAKAEKAVNALLAMKKLTENNFFTSRRLAILYYRRLNKFDLALKYARELENNKTCTASARAHGIYYAANIYQQTRKNDKAVAEWEKLEKCGVPYFQNMAKKQLKRK